MPYQMYQPFYGQPVPDMQFQNPYQRQMVPNQTQVQQPQVQQPQMMQGQQVQQAQQPQGISPVSRPVGNREEANAVPADFSGAPMLFPDVAHGRVYMKRWNMQTGAAEFFEYALIVDQARAEPVRAEQPSFAPLDYAQGLELQIAALKNELFKLKDEMKGVVKHGADDE